MPYEVIARKYRPQRFDEVVGQPVVVKTLKNAIQYNRIAHAYIFSGTRGVGKTTVARILAKAVNCAQGPSPEPDGVCDSCREIARGNSIDVLEIDAASNRGIDEIRELRETARYLPARDRYKVFIIDEAHMLTTEAFNALLKTLEEPPSRSLFVLATTEPHKLPTTILSRCQHFSFRLLDYSEIVAHLETIARGEKVAADEDALAVIAQAAEGSLRDALSLLDQAIAASGERLDAGQVRQLLGVVPADLLAEMVEGVLAADSSRVLSLVDRLTDEGYDLGAFVAGFVRFVRDLMIARTCGVESPLLQTPDGVRKRLGELAPRLSEEDLTRFLQILLRTESELRYALAPRFHLELGLMKLVHAKRLASLESLLAGLASEAATAPTPAAGASSPPGRAPAPLEPPAPARKASPATTPQPAERAVSPPPAPVRSAVASDPQLEAIKSHLFDSSRKFVSSCLEHISGWRAENGEVVFIFSKQNSGGVWAELLKGKETQEALAAACARVLGQPVRIRVRLDEGQGALRGEAPPGARERAALDPQVQALAKQFDCVWLDVQDLTRRG